MEDLLAALATALERPREVSLQVARHLAGAHEVDRPAIGQFLREGLPKLEDYEVEFILSPLFTPTLADQAPFAELLGATAVPREQWPQLVLQLLNRPTVAQISTEDGAIHPVPLREIILERFVHRLRLDGTIAESIDTLIDHLPPAADRPMLKAIARRAVWERDARRQILYRHLAGASSEDGYRLDDVIALLKLVETYEPEDLADFLRRIPHWEQVLRHEISLAAGPKAFFNERVEELHGGGRDQRVHRGTNTAAQELELAVLERLRATLAR